MNLTNSVADFLEYQKSIRGLAENTVLSYKRDLEYLKSCLIDSNDDIEVSSISLMDLRSCVGCLSREKKAAASINQFIAAIRTFFSYCRKFEIITTNPALELKIIKQPKKIPRFMTSDEVNAMCKIPDDINILWPQRDKAIFELLYSSGCRVSEIANLSLKDLSVDYSSARVIGKGNKERRVFFSDEAIASLKEYFLSRKSKITNQIEQSNNVFVNQKGNALSVRGIQYIVSRYSSSEGTNKPVSPHAFRHTFATTMLSNGADIRVVQEMLGHSSISTTQRYTHITTNQLIKTYNQSHPHGEVKDRKEKNEITEKSDKEKNN